MTTIDLGSTGLRATKKGGVLRVVLDRPDRRNSCTVEMYHGIKKAAVLAERDPEIDVLVLTGRGTTSASAARWAVSTRAARRSIARPTAST